MFTRDVAVVDRRKAGIAVVFLTLSACQFPTPQARHNRVITLRSAVTSSSVPIASTVTSIRTQLGNAVTITAAHPMTAPKYVPFDPSAPTTEDIAEEPEPTTEVPTTVTTTTTAAPTTTVKTVTTVATTTTVAPTSTSAATTTTTEPHASTAHATTTTAGATTTGSAVTTTSTGPTTTTTTTTTSTTTVATTTTSSIAPGSATLSSADGTKRATSAFAAAQVTRDACLTGPASCQIADLRAFYSGPALAEVTAMVDGLRRANARVSIASGDGYVLESAAVNQAQTRASLSGCFTTVRDTLDGNGNLLTTSTDSTREAFEMTQVNGVWSVTTHRALGLC
jgi:hypothetical protein